MGKKIEAYQARDGKTFVGEDSERKMKNHERKLDQIEKVKAAVKQSRIIFDVPDPEDYEMGTPESYKEEDFLEGVGLDNTDLDFEDMIKLFVTLRAYNKSGFDRLISYIRRHA